jgi:hypothetical protein
MCTLYSVITNQEAIRQMFGVDVDNTGNMPPQPGVYPDYAAPTVRNSAAGRELAMARWGMLLAEQCLELGEGVLDRIEVWAVGRQVAQLRTCGLDEVAHARPFMAGLELTVIVRCRPRWSWVDAAASGSSGRL